MPATLEAQEVEVTPAVRETGTSQPELYRWSVEQYQRMVDAGVLGKADRVELLDGHVVSKMTNNPRHSGLIERLSDRLWRVLPPEWSLRVQLPIQSVRSQPEPDLAIVRRDRDHSRHPIGAETALVIEISDSTLPRDRSKAAIYAQAGVSAYWIVNANDMRVEVYSRVNIQSGEYESLLIHHEGDSIQFAAEPGLQIDIPVAELLPHS